MTKTLYILICATCFFRISVMILVILNYISRGFLQALQRSNTTRPLLLLSIYFSSIRHSPFHPTIHIQVSGRSVLTLQRTIDYAEDVYINIFFRQRDDIIWGCMWEVVF
jgi:hypothetical protein